MPQKKFILFFHSFLLLIIFSLNTAPAAQKMARIIGGLPADPNAWPWMSGLVYKNSPISSGVFCGASLISKEWVLTAAHCLINKSHTSFDVFTNQAKLDNAIPERLSVERIIFHPLFDQFSLVNDLALIKLTSPSDIQPIMVLAPFTSQDNESKSAIALGWGAISENPPQYPTDLQQISLPLINNQLCEKSMGNITNDMLCAGDGLGHKDTCFGDSGGPLVIFDTESQTWRQAGITSWGFGCAEPGFYGVYTRLKNYATFISQHICTTSKTHPPVSLKLNIDGNIVSANWSAINNISGYRLNYAPYPEALSIDSIDMNQSTNYSVKLKTGSAYYVAISSYNTNCLSDYSNIEHFSIK